MTEVEKRMKARLIQIEKRNKEAREVIDMSKVALFQVFINLPIDIKHAENLKNIILYWEQHIKRHNYEKLFINTYLSRKVNDIVKIIPNVRQKFIASSSEICELYCKFTLIDNMTDFDEYSYIQTCKEIKREVDCFTQLCDGIFERFNEFIKKQDAKNKILD